MSALISSTEPATRRVPNRAAHPVRRCAPKPAIRSAGAVPRPNAAIVIAPSTALLLQRGDQQDGVNKPAGHPAPDHAECKCARPARNRQQATSERREPAPDPMANTQTRIAHSTECDERGKEQRKRRQRAQALGVPIRYPAARSSRRAFRRTADLRANMKRCARADSRSGAAAVDVHRPPRTVATPSAAVMPPHIARQCPLAARPSSNAAADESCHGALVRRASRADHHRAAATPASPGRRTDRDRPPRRRKPQQPAAG